MATKRYEFKIVHASFHNDETEHALDEAGSKGFYFVAYLGNDDILLQRDVEPARQLAAFETEDGHKIYFETTGDTNVDVDVDAASGPARAE